MDSRALDEAQRTIEDTASEVEARLAAQGTPDVAKIERELAAVQKAKQRLIKLAALTDDLDAIAGEMRDANEQIKRLETALARATGARIDTRTIVAEIKTVAGQKLDTLRAALHGPNARDAIHALFPQGLRLLVVGETRLLHRRGRGRPL